MTGSASKWDLSAWFGVKFSQGLDFPNLPYYKAGEVKLTGTNAILRHIARENNMCGNSAMERARVDMAAEQVMDMRWDISHGRHGRTRVMVIIVGHGS